MWKQTIQQNIQGIPYMLFITIKRYSSGSIVFLHNKMLATLETNTRTTISGGKSRNSPLAITQNQPLFPRVSVLCQTVEQWRPLGTLTR
ncbi:hypothetical protein SAM19_03185 [Brevibacillus laterosporus]|nr:hypothetical protein [Brevibacillus laterosporus]